MCCRTTSGTRWCSCAAADRAWSIRRGASTSTCSRESGSPRSVTRIAGWRTRWPTQAGELLHVSNLFFHPLQGEVAERLARLSGLPRAFFCNSGTEAVEACLKFARRYWRTQGADERHEIVAFEGAFHGRTFGSLSVTAGEPYRTPFAPLLPGVRFVSPTDPDGVRDAVTERTAAVIVEPIQGEGGVRPIPRATAGGHRRGVRGDGDAADRRRGAVRPRAHGPAVLQRGPRADSRPDVRRQVAGGRLSGRRGAHERGGRRGGVLRRSRHHLRREPAGVPRGAGIPRRPRQRPHRTRGDRRPPLPAGPRRTRGGQRRHSRGARGRPHVGHRGRPGGGGPRRSTAPSRADC